MTESISSSMQQTSPLVPKKREKSGEGKNLRVLCWYDTPHQSALISPIETALKNDARGHVLMRAGPGTGADFFNMAHEIMPPPQKKRGHWIIPLGMLKFIGRHILNRPLRRIVSRICLLLSVERPLARYRQIRNSLRSISRRTMQIWKEAVYSGDVFLFPRKMERELGLSLAIVGVVASPLIVAYFTLFLDVLSPFRQRRVLLANARALLRRAKADVHIIFEDNVEGLSGVFTQAARETGAPLIIVPDYIPNPNEPAAFYHSSFSHGVSTPRAKFYTWISPKWQYVYKKRPLLRLPLRQIIAQRLSGNRPVAPWILNAGYSERIALESNAMGDHYRNLGFMDVKLAIIGSPRDDLLFDAIAQTLATRDKELQRFGFLDNTKPLIVCGFPPDQFRGSSTGTFEFSSFESMSIGWFEGFKLLKDHANIIVRPHPRLQASSLRQFEHDGLRVVDDVSTETVLALADLYVASISTTIRWALALGIPVLNYDCYRYAYGDFSSALGALEVNEVQAFHATLKKLVIEKNLSSLTQAAKADRERWGNVDGKFSERFLALAKEVAARGCTATPTHSVGEVAGVQTRGVVAR